MNKLIVIVLLFIGIHSVYGQHIPLNNDYMEPIEAAILKKSPETHTAIKPYSYFEVNELRDSIIAEKKFKKEIDQKFKRWLFNAAFNDNFLQLDDKKGKFSLILNPIVDFRSGSSSDLDGLPYVNTRGIQIKGRIGKNVAFYSDFHENQARFPRYVNEIIEENLVVPGQGFPKDFDSQLNDNTDALDFAYVNGNVTIKANEFFTLEGGTGKNFIGDGYRSVIFSDNTFNYPYFKLNTSVWRIKYVNIYSQMMDVKGTNYNNSTFEKKHISSHYLSINATKNFNIGLFESVVYQDSTGTLDPGFFNPIIFYRPIEFSIGSRSGNVIMGLTMSYKIKQKMMFYGQIMIDEFNFGELLANEGWWANKYAFQLGFKSYDTFIQGLKVQTELNYARPYTYSHQTSGRSYSHYRQSLAHPLGANFIESVNIASYQKGRWYGRIELMYALQGLDTLGSNVGTNVLLPYNTRDGDFGHETLQGIKATTTYADLRVGYVVNPTMNLRLELGASIRRFKPEIETEELQPLNTTYIHFGLTTALNNKYYDF